MRLGNSHTVSSSAACPEPAHCHAHQIHLVLLPLRDGVMRLRGVGRVRPHGLVGLLAVRELRRRLNTTDGNFTTHLRKLADAGYVSVRRQGSGRASHTSVTLTPTGRQAFLTYLDTMTRLAREQGHD
jgi:DNA-binding transcriptional ArsR family regulator